MPPVEVYPKKESIKEFIDKNDFVIFSKSTCPFCSKAKELFKAKNIPLVSAELDLKGSDGNLIQVLLYGMSGQRTVPLIFCYGSLIGGCDDLLDLERLSKLDRTIKMYKEHRDLKNSNSTTFDYDLAVIGGGSGGLACAKEASSNGQKVVLFDFVKPSPHGSKWGLGGTCVNVGCIPKKLMHQAAIHGDNIRKAEKYGWAVPTERKHDWNTMCNNIQSHIKSLNFAYRGALTKKGVKYVNAFARIVSKHEIIGVHANGTETKITSKFIVLSPGERPQLPDVVGAEYCITSDDLFWLKYQPGKILIVGASYVALECGGALHGMGYDVTIMVRSIFLRGYDQEMAERVGKYMEEHGVKFIRSSVPVKVEQLTAPDTSSGEPGLHKVYYKSSNQSESNEIHSDTFNTVMFAIGRVSCTSGIGLESVGVEIDNRKRVIAVDNHESTTCSNIFAIGDVLSQRPQLTPVAIKSGKLLAKRLCSFSYENTNYNVVPTTVFTPLEYGAIGLSEEDAISKFGKDDITVFYDYISPLEESIVHENNPTDFYAKLICRRSQNNKVVGFHILAPGAGEITQGYAVAIGMGATYLDFSRTFGIHPTNSEVFTGMSITKDSGVEVIPGGC